VAERVQMSQSVYFDWWDDLKQARFAARCWPRPKRFFGTGGGRLECHVFVESEGGGGLTISFFDESESTMKPPSPPENDDLADS
jgi:hypothetical protein